MHEADIVLVGRVEKVVELLFPDLTLVFLDRAVAVVVLECGDRTHESLGDTVLGLPGDTIELLVVKRDTLGESEAGWVFEDRVDDLLALDLLGALGRPLGFGTEPQDECPVLVTRDRVGLGPQPHDEIDPAIAGVLVVRVVADGADVVVGQPHGTTLLRDVALDDLGDHELEGLQVLELDPHTTADTVLPGVVDLELEWGGVFAVPSEQTLEFAEHGMLLC